MTLIPIGADDFSYRTIIEGLRGVLERDHEQELARTFVEAIRSLESGKVGLSLLKAKPHTARVADGLEQSVKEIKERMMLTTTRSMGFWSFSLEDWKVIEVTHIDGQRGVERHTFWYCRDTHRHQISAELLEDTQEWILTRSRRYYKVGLTRRGWVIEELIGHTEFLEIWRIADDEIQAAVEAHR